MNNEPDPLLDFPERKEGWPLRIQVPEPPPASKSIKPGLITFLIFAGISGLISLFHLFVPAVAPNASLAVNLVVSAGLGFLVFLICLSR